MLVLGGCLTFARMASVLELATGLLAEAGEADVAGEGVQGEGGPGMDRDLAEGSLSSGQSVIR